MLEVDLIKSPLLLIVLATEFSSKSIEAVRSTVFVPLAGIFTTIGTNVGFAGIEIVTIADVENEFILKYIGRSYCSYKG